MFCDLLRLVRGGCYGFLGMGFARAARVMSQLEAAGIVGPQDGKAKNREVLVTSFDELDVILKAFMK